MMAAQEIIPSGIAKDISLQLLNEILLVLSELNAKAPRLDTGGRTVVNAGETGMAIAINANQTLANLSLLNGFGGGTLSIVGTQVAVAEQQQAEFQFLQLINLI